MRRFFFPAALFAALIGLMFATSARGASLPTWNYLPLALAVPAATPNPAPEPTNTPTRTPSVATPTPTNTQPTATALPTNTPTTGAITTPTPTLPPATYNNCAAEPNANAAPNYPMKIVTVNKVAETVTLKNTSTNPVSLTGWHMCSITGNQQHPIGGTLYPGQSATFPGPTGSIWNNDKKDDGALYNADGQLVSYWFDSDG